jgi:hypothetical protein
MHTSRVISYIATGAAVLLLCTGCPKADKDVNVVLTDKPEDLAVLQPEDPNVQLPLAVMLPVDAIRVELPADLADDYEGAVFSEDRASMKVAFPESGMVYYFTAFNTQLPHKAIMEHFDEQFADDELEPAEFNPDSLADEGYFQAVYATEMGEFGARVYNFDHAASLTGGTETPLVLLLQDRSMEPEPAPDEDAA